MTAAEYQTYLVRLALEAHDTAMGDARDPYTSLRDGFEARVRERMAQAAQIFAGELAEAVETERARIVELARSSR